MGKHYREMTANAVALRAVFIALVLVGWSVECAAKGARRRCGSTSALGSLSVGGEFNGSGSFRFQPVNPDTQEPVGSPTEIEYSGDIRILFIDTTPLLLGRHFEFFEELDDEFGFSLKYICQMVSNTAFQCAAEASSCVANGSFNINRRCQATGISVFATAIACAPLSIVILLSVCLLNLEQPAKSSFNSSVLSL